MADDGPDLVMRLYWDCQALQQKLSTLTQPGDRKEKIINFLDTVESKYPDPIPEFQPDMAWFNVGQSVTVDSLRGTLPLLDFFTYCCVNCHHILPSLARLEETYGEQGLVVIGVHSAKFDNEKEAEQVRHAVRRYGIRHPVCSDAGAVLWRALGVTCWPTQLLLSPRGAPLHVAMGEGHDTFMQELVKVAIEHFGGFGRLGGRGPSVCLEEEVGGSLLAYPGKVGVGGGRLVVADTGHHRLLVIDGEGRVEEVVGSGVAGHRDGDLASAQFRGPQGVCVVGEVVWVADTENHCVRRVDLASRRVDTVAGVPGVQGQDKEGGGQGPVQPLSSPWDLARVEGLAGEGWGLVVAMAGSHQLWLYAVTDLVWWKGVSYGAGTMVRVAGSGAEENRNNSYPAKAGFAQPSGVAVGREAVYVADSESSTVRKVALKDGSVKALVGGEIDPTNLFAYGDCEGEGRKAKLQHPLGVVVGEEGVLYVADSYNHKVKKISLEGSKAVVTSLVSGLSEPGGLCLSEDLARLYVADTNHHCVQVIHLASGVMARLEVAHQQEVRQEEVRTTSHTVGQGEGVLTITAATSPAGGTKLNPEGPSSWSLTVDQTDGGWQFHPKGKLEPDSSGSVAWSVEHPGLPRCGAALSLRLRLYVCEEEGGVCRVLERRHNITLLPGQGEDDFTKFDIGNLLE